MNSESGGKILCPPFVYLCSTCGINLNRVSSTLFYKFIILETRILAQMIVGLHSVHPCFSVMDRRITNVGMSLKWTSTSRFKTNSVCHVSESPHVEEWDTNLHYHHSVMWTRGFYLSCRPRSLIQLIICMQYSCHLK